MSLWNPNIRRTFQSVKVDNSYHPDSDMLESVIGIRNSLNRKGSVHSLKNLLDLPLGMVGLNRSPGLCGSPYTRLSYS